MRERWCVSFHLWPDRTQLVQYPLRTADSDYFALRRVPFCIRAVAADTLARGGCNLCRQRQLVCLAGRTGM